MSRKAPQDPPPGAVKPGPPPLPPPSVEFAEALQRKRVSIEMEDSDPMRTRVMVGDVQIEGVQKIELVVNPKRVITRIELDRVFLQAGLVKVEIEQEDLVALCRAAGWSVDQMTKIER